MNEMQVFESADLGQIRALTRDGEPWFVAADVCRVLGHTNPTIALGRLDDDERAKFNLGHPYGETNIVNEPGLYSLVLGSRKPEARAFKRWVTHAVIPAIRKTGGYIAGEAEMTDDELLSRALLVMQEKLRQREVRLGKAEMENARLTVENQTMAPKADYFDALVDRNLLTNFRETAKQLGIREQHFIRYLIDHGYIYRDKRGKLMPTAKKNNGLFEVKECTNDKTNWSGTQTMITPKGRETFRLLTQGL